MVVTMAYDFDTAQLETRSQSDIVSDMMLALNNLDALAREMERKWGHERLPALVPQDLAKKFYSQRAKLAKASSEHRDEDTIVEAGKMETAWRYLDAQAERLGAEPIHPSVWETSLSDGTVVAIVRDSDEAAAVEPSDRKMVVYTLEEIARLLEANRTVSAIKEEFPGAKVRASRVLPPDSFWERGDEEWPF